MSDLDSLFAANVKWAGDIKREDPEFFSNLAKQQAPEYLWIGCSDSRVPANQILNLAPGEIFVHPYHGFHVASAQEIFVSRTISPRRHTRRRPPRSGTDPSP